MMSAARQERIARNILAAANALPSVRLVPELLPQLSTAAQAVYDAWDQDESGYDEMLGYGGICQDIADAIAGVLSEAGIDARTQDNCGMGEQHVWAIAKFQEGIYEIDIHPSVYERGGGYNWKKITGVQFQSGDISVTRLSADPNEWENFLE